MTHSHIVKLVLKEKEFFTYFKQLLDDVLVISGIIMVNVGVISQVEGLS